MGDLITELQASFGRICTLMQTLCDFIMFLITGILAGVWPCGTITMLGELFGAESKGQVYGHLNSYLFDNESLTSTISKM